MINTLVIPQKQRTHRIVVSEIDRINTEDFASYVFCAENVFVLNLTEEPDLIYAVAEVLRNEADRTEAKLLAALHPANMR